MRVKHPRFLASDPKFLGLDLFEIVWFAFALILSRVFNFGIVVLAIFIITGIGLGRLAAKIELVRKIQNISKAKVIKLKDLKKVL